MQVMKAVGVFLLSIALGGCSYFTRPMEKPVIKDKLAPSWSSAASVGMLSLTPERRIVLQNFRTQRFCAEAPTEVGIDLSSAAKAIAKADVVDEVKAEIGLALASASSNSVLNKRSQGVQLFLANSYFVCQMYMNGAISADQMLEYQTRVFNSAATLIELEVPYLYEKGAPPAPERAKPTKEYTPVDPTKLPDLSNEKDESKIAPKPAPKPDATAPDVIPDAVDAIPEGANKGSE